MKHLTIAMPILLAALVGGCNRSPEELLADGRESYAAHRFAEARVQLIGAAEGMEAKAEALELLARTQLELGDGEAAAATLEKLAAGGKTPPDAAILRGEAELLRGNADKARAAVERSTSADAWRIRALAALLANDVDAAADAFARGASADGDRSRLLAESARFAVRRGDLPAARKELAASRAAGVSLETLFGEGELAATTGDFAKALAAYGQALTKWPESRAALLGKLGALGDLGRTKEMEPILAAAMERAPGDPSLVYMSARLAADRGDWGKARDLLQPLEPRMRDLPQARLLYGRALVELGLHQQAIGHLAAIVQAAPANRAAVELLARAQLGAGSPARAVQTLRPLASASNARASDIVLMAAATRAAKSPDASDWKSRADAAGSKQIAARLARADAALGKGDWSGAAADYRAVNVLTGESSVMALNNLAYAEGRLGNHAVSLQYARKALKRAPDNPSVLDTAGWIMVESKIDPEGGRALLRKAAKLEPDNAAIRDHLKRAG